MLNRWKYHNLINFKLKWTIFINFYFIIIAFSAFYILSCAQLHYRHSIFIHSNWLTLIMSLNLQICEWKYWYEYICSLTRLHAKILNICINFTMNKHSHFHINKDHFTWKRIIYFFYALNRVVPQGGWDGSFCLSDCCYWRQ